MFLLVPAYPGSPGQKAVKRLCLCVCVCVCVAALACGPSYFQHCSVTFCEFSTVISASLLNSELLHGSAWIVRGAGSMKRYGVRPRVRVCLSVPAWAHSSKPAATSWLLWAQLAGDIDPFSSSVCRAVPRCQRT